MAYETAVGPAQLTVNVGECVPTTETDGQTRQPSDRGFCRDTRLRGGWTVEVDGRSWSGTLLVDPFSPAEARVAGR